MNWHLPDPEEILERTNASRNGLGHADAEARLLTAGPNELTQKKKKSALSILLGQFRDFMTLVLVAAAVISGIVGDRTDTIIILAIVVRNALLGFLQQFRAEKALEALNRMGDPTCNAWRDGRPETIPVSAFVPGDIILLDAGNVIPADLRLLETQALTVMEAALTGESVPVQKSTQVLSGDTHSLGDRLNMAYKGTQVTNGRARGVVVATGMNTEIGQIARLLQAPESETPLQTRMRDFGKKLSVFVLAICVVLFGVGLLRGEAPLTMLLLAITLAGTFLLQLAVIYLPAANALFHTQPLSGQELLACIGIAARPFHAVELEKWIRARRRRKAMQIQAA